MSQGQVFKPVDPLDTLGDGGMSGYIVDGKDYGLVYGKPRVGTKSVNKTGRILGFLEFVH